MGEIDADRPRKNKTSLTPKLQPRSNPRKKMSTFSVLPTVQEEHQTDESGHGKNRSDENALEGPDSFDGKDLDDSNTPLHVSSNPIKN